MPDVFKHTEKTDKKETKSHITTRKPSGWPMMSAFMVRPNGIRFETQQEEETILLFMRQHLIVNLNWVLTTLVLVLLPAFGTPLIFSVGLSRELPAGYFVVLPLLWYLGVFGFAFTNFLKWNYNVYIVTNERIVDIDWLSLLYKQLSSTQLERIQDVTYKQGGLLDSFFNFGNVYIQTAGTEPNFEFEAVPKPDEVVREIDRILEHKQKGVGV